VTPAEVAARIGSVVDGKYRLDGVLGAGGLGVVYRATHLTLGSPVAVKFLHAEVAGDGEMRVRFEREARILATLRHPGIVVAHDFGEHEGSAYLVMEVVEGEALADHVVVDGAAMPYRRAVDIAQKILEVLEVAHEAHVIHRDLKPENVMLVRRADTDTVKLLDFGIALVDKEGVPRLTATHAIQGTPHYMSPEQCRGRNVGPPTDVYALGVVLYELLAGGVPFEGESVADLMAKHLYIAPPPMSEVGVGRPVPGELERITLSALAKKPGDRPTVTALREALAGWLAGTSAVAVAARSTDDRIRDLALSRRERALPDIVLGSAPTATASSPPPLATTEEGPSVLLFGLDRERASLLKSVLGVNGFTAVIAKKPELADALAAAPDARAVIVPGDAAATARTTALRAANPARAVLVVDLRDAAALPALVRAGAGDVVPEGVGDEVVAKKLRKLLRRR
jgi:serine/threonine protein kinase